MEKHHQHQHTNKKIPGANVSVEEIYKQTIADGLTYLSIQNEHLYGYEKIELFENHCDPFDRLLIATAIEERAILLSVDDKFNLYNDILNVVW